MLKRILLRNRLTWKLVESGKGFIFRRFALWEKLGVHVLPNHFYTPIPNTRALTDELWEQPSEMVGVNMNESGQLTLLERLAAGFKAEYDRFPATLTKIPYQYYRDNGMFLAVDAEILYAK